jgi:Protein of unknown function (DUF3990)
MPGELARRKKRNGMDQWPMTLYHGTVGPFSDDIQANGIQLARCSLKTDFAQGFYLTRIYEQAVRYANQRYEEMMDDHHRLGNSFNPVCAAVVHFTIDRDDLGHLETLAFVQPTPDWREFVSHCHLPSNTHLAKKGGYYDVVYGPMAIDTGGVIADCEQISFHTQDAVALLVLQTVTIGKARIT